MTTMEILKYLQQEIHTTIVATVNNGLIFLMMVILSVLPAMYEK